MIVIHEERCTICSQCILVCPEEAIKGWQFPEIDQERCTGCLKCIDYCPTDALEEVE
jgi:NAD-dependent dihydropyrimidine dehydrogenase PreA subunit